MDEKEEIKTEKTDIDFELNQRDLEPSQSDIDEAASDDATLPPKKPPHKRVWHWTKNLTKKQKLLLLFVVILLVALTCAGAIWALRGQPGPQSNVAVRLSDEVQSELTGLMVLPEVNERQVTAVMIENSPDARPQAGIINAGVVYEAVAEGGITRFVALYQDTKASYLGPVRSIRPYYLDFLVPYGAAVAHVGGSPQAIQQMRAQNIKDLDQFVNPTAYDRVSSRFAPHNVYTSTTRLNQVEKRKKYKQKPYDGFEREKREAPLDKAKIKTININYISDLYNVSYKYNKASNTYKRTLGGVPHKDEKSGKQIAPKVVVAIEMKRTQDGVYSVYKTTGSGKVRVYQNGTVIVGKWSKKNRKSQFVLTDKNGDPIKLVPGKTWVNIVESGRVTQK